MSKAKKTLTYNSKEPVTQFNEPPSEYNMVNRAVGYLGGKSLGVVATSIQEDHDFIHLIKKGVPRKSLDYLMLTTGLNSNELASIMHTSDRTLRRYKPSKLLNTEQSERVVELARLYSRGEEVFENMDSFKEWMDSTVMAIGNKKPKELLDTSLGIEFLMDELGRIEQGVFA